MQQDLVPGPRPASQASVSGKAAPARVAEEARVAPATQPRVRRRSPGASGRFLEAQLRVRRAVGGARALAWGGSGLLRASRCSSAVKGLLEVSSVYSRTRQTVHKFIQLLPALVVGWPLS